MGAGAGKYGHLLRRAAPQCETLAIAVESRHLEAFELGDVYAEVVQTDAAPWWRDNTEVVFDLTIAGDCLQHLPKGAGLDLLNASLAAKRRRLICRSHRGG